MVVDSEVTPPDAEMTDPNAMVVEDSTPHLEGVSAGATKLLTSLLTPEALKHLPSNKSVIVSEFKTSEGEIQYTLSTGPLVPEEGSVITLPNPADVVPQLCLINSFQLNSFRLNSSLLNSSLHNRFLVNNLLTSCCRKCKEKRERGVTGVIAKSGKFYCSKCGKEYSHRSTANKHLKGCGVESVKEFKCEVEECTEAYSNARGLLEHNAAQHTKEYLYFCKNDGCPRKTEGFYYMSRASEHKVNCLYKPLTPAMTMGIGQVATLPGHVPPQLPGQVPELPKFRFYLKLPPKFQVKFYLKVPPKFRFHLKVPPKFHLKVPLKLHFQVVQLKL